MWVETPCAASCSAAWIVQKLPAPQFQCHHHSPPSPPVLAQHPAWDWAASPVSTVLMQNLSLLSQQCAQAAGTTVSVPPPLAAFTTGTGQAPGIGLGGSQLDTNAAITCRHQAVHKPWNNGHATPCPAATGVRTSSRHHSISAPTSGRLHHRHGPSTGHRTGRQPPSHQCSPGGAAGSSLGGEGRRRCWECGRSCTCGERSWLAAAG